MRYAVVVCLFAGAAFANDADWTQSVALGNALAHAGKYTDSVEAFRNAVKAAEETRPPTFHLPAALNYLGLAYDAVGRRTDAIPQYRRALAILESQSGKDTPDYATVLTNLAGDLADNGQRPTGEAMYREAIAIYHRTLPDDRVHLALTENSYAELLVDMGRTSDAEEVLLRVLSVLQGRPEFRAHCAFTLNNLGAVRRNQGRLDEAADYFRQALALVEIEFGADHPKVLRPLANLALVETSLGQTGVAEPLYKRALTVTEQRLGLEHPDYAMILLNYSVMLRKAGRKREAKTFEARGNELLRAADRTLGRGLTIDAASFR